MVSLRRVGGMRYWGTTGNSLSKLLLNLTNELHYLGAAATPLERAVGVPTYVDAALFAFFTQ